jgi:3-dehydroquinate dehydratase-2
VQALIHAAPELGVSHLVQVLVLNGVNLDTLARRDPSVYGGLSLNELETKIYEWAHGLDISARCRQSNNEGEFIEWIHDSYDNVDALIVNPGAWSHYSYAIRDALELSDVPIIEVHLSNIEEREDWRRNSVIADVVSRRVIGKGPEGYREALQYLAGQDGA